MFKRDLEQVVHGEVWARLNDFWTKAHLRQEPLTFAEIPLWFETGFKPKTSVLTICVRTPKKIRFERLKNSRHWSDEKINAIEGWQWDEDRKAKSADYILDNSKTIAVFETNAKKFFDNLLLRASQDNKAAENKLIELLGAENKPEICG